MSDSDASRRPSSIAARLLTGGVVAYRRWISPALPPRCRFYPSCSAYAQEALTRHGAVRGVALTFWRLLRCHPFHPGGFDPVPEQARRGPAGARGTADPGRHPADSGRPADATGA